MSSALCFPHTSRQVYIPTYLVTTVVGAYQVYYSSLHGSIAGLVASFGLIVVGILGVVYHLRAKMTLTEMYIETTGIITRRVKWADIRSVSQVRGSLVIKGTRQRIRVSYPVYHWPPVARMIIPQLNSLPVLGVDVDLSIWGLLPRDQKGRLIRS